MKSKTIVCAYGKNEPVERVFERLFAMYTSNYSPSYYYCALIDLPDGISYRTAGDREIEDGARMLVNKLSGVFSGRLMCAVRQRRTRESDIGHAYACEGGADGALGALWRYLCGKEDGLFPIYGCDCRGGAERIYFSSRTYDERLLKSLSDAFIDVIQPNGIFGLASELTSDDAVFTESEYAFSEGLYTSGALDRLICALPAYYERRRSKTVGLVRYPSGSFLQRYDI